MLLNRYIYPVILAYFLGVSSSLASNNESPQDILIKCRKNCLDINKQCMKPITMRSSNSLGTDWVKKFAPTIAQEKVNEIESRAKSSSEQRQNDWSVTSTDTNTAFEFLKRNAFGITEKFEISNQILMQNCTTALTNCKKLCKEHAHEG